MRSESIGTLLYFEYIFNKIYITPQTLCRSGIIFEFRNNGKYPGLGHLRFCGG